MANLIIRRGYLFNTRTIGLTVSDALNLQEATLHLFSNAILEKVVVFSLRIRNKRDMYKLTETSWNMYIDIFKALPSLKRVDLMIPKSYVDDPDTAIDQFFHSLVEIVYLHVFRDLQIQVLLNRLCYTFPNMKHLKLENQYGIWNQDIGQLELDATFVIRHGWEEWIGDNYFVLDVVSHGNSDRRQYKVTDDLQSIVKINDGDLNDLRPRDDYIRLKVIVKNLPKIYLFYESTVLEVL